MNEEQRTKKNAYEREIYHYPELLNKDRNRGQSYEDKMWLNAKSRANKAGVPFTISVTDIHMPDVCPYLGIRLQKSTTGSISPASPSLDRIIPSLGYVPGNVEVISSKANVMKNDATPEELIRFAEAVLRR